MNIKKIRTALHAGFQFARMPSLSTWSRLFSARHLKKFSYAKTMSRLSRNWGGGDQPFDVVRQESIR